MKLKLELNNKKINSPKDITDIFQTILKSEDKISRDQEHFWVLSLGSNQEVKSIELLALGGANTVNVSTKDIFRRAIIAGAERIVISHNHPSGDVEPSTADMEVTKRLQKAGELLGIMVLDHIIISSKDSYSFKANGKL